MSSSPPAPAVPAPPTGPRGPGCIGWSLLGALAVAVVGGLASAGLWARGSLAPPTQVVVVGIATPMSFPTLPPTGTASPTPTETLVPSPSPTRTPTGTPTLPPPNPTLAAEMNVINQQVADLRGLAVQGENPRFLVARHQVEDVLSSRVLTPALRAKLEDQQRVLAALGLIKPTYDLLKYALNSHADHLGGFYLPWTQELYVIGSEFSGIERFVYSHEYGHALVDAHFDIAGLGVYPVCLDDAQRCAAIRALVEGDATLLMEQWWQQYATPQDYLDLAQYEPPEFALPEEFPPPYVSQDLAFPYDYGYAFVDYLHQRGNWAAVNRAYSDLPQSTEHILHPDKYLAGEAPLPVALPAQPSLSAGWRLLQADALGEWMTYLILGYGADLSAQVPLDLAEAAAEGWGGDRYQVYYQADTGAAVLVARWAWDRPRDADEFAQAMRQHLEARFRGGAVDRTDGECMEANAQASCLFTREGESLWLLAPDQVVLNNVLLEFPDF